MTGLAVYKAIANITAALAKTGIAKHRPAVPSVGVNYEFRGIDDIYNSLAPLLAENMLCILPSVLDRTCVERQTKSGGAIFYVTVKVKFDFVAADGSKHEITTFGEAMDISDKATNKAMSAAYKYAAMMAFCIPTVGEDSENDTHEVSATAVVAVLPRRGGSPTVPKMLTASPMPPHDEATGEIGPVLIPFNDTWVEWGGRYISGMKSATTLDELDEWDRLNGPSLDVMATKSPKAFASVRAAVNVQTNKITLSNSFRATDEALVQVGDAASIMK